jgi:uncharacterized membrane protein YfcA
MILLGLALSLLIGISLGFFGGGGSILTVPLLVYVFGLDPKSAIASSLLIVSAASSAGAFQHWRAGNLRIETALVFGGAGILGAFAGAQAGQRIDAEILLVLFAGMMILTAAAMWRGRRNVTDAAPEGSQARGKLVLQGFAVGSFTGLVGAGGGFLIVPALALWAGLSMPAAVGTSLFIIILNSMAGFLGYVTKVPLDFALIAMVAGCAIAGSFIGSKLAHVVEPGSLRRFFAVFVMAMGGLILVREGGLVVEAAASALPRSVPQLLFVAVVLAVGVAAGRVSRGPGADDPAEQTFRHGEGI